LWLPSVKTQATLICRLEAALGERIWVSDRITFGGAQTASRLSPRAGQHKRSSQRPRRDITVPSMIAVQARYVDSARRWGKPAASVAMRTVSAHVDDASSPDNA
jgi:hypothetical protein